MSSLLYSQVIADMEGSYVTQTTIQSVNYAGVGGFWLPIPCYINIRTLNWSKIPDTCKNGLSQSKMFRRVQTDMTIFTGLNVTA